MQKEVEKDGSPFQSIDLGFVHVSIYGPLSWTYYYIVFDFSQCVPKIRNCERNKIQRPRLLVGAVAAKPLNIYCLAVQTPPDIFGWIRQYSHMVGKRVERILAWAMMDYEGFRPYEPIPLNQSILVIVRRITKVANIAFYIDMRRLKFAFYQLIYFYRLPFLNFE